jgi:hypothetical protein
VEVLGGVLVLGRIAAAHVSAGQAKTQMDPVIADLQAIFAAVGGWFDLVNLVEMSALGGHGVSSLGLERRLAKFDATKKRPGRSRAWS